VTDFVRRYKFFSPFFKFWGRFKFEALSKGLDALAQGRLWKSLMFDIAENAMQELILLMETNELLWMKSNTDGRDTLNLETYETMFPRTTNRLKNSNIRIEASRNSGDVIMNALTLVEMFMDPVRTSYFYIVIF